MLKLKKHQKWYTSTQIAVFFPFTAHFTPNSAKDKKTEAATFAENFRLATCLYFQCFSLTRFVSFQFLHETSMIETSQSFGTNETWKDINLRLISVPWL